MMRLNAARTHQSSVDTSFTRSLGKQPLTPTQITAYNHALLQRQRAALDQREQAVCQRQQHECLPCGALHIQHAPAAAQTCTDGKGESGKDESGKDEPGADEVSGRRAPAAGGAAVLRGSPSRGEGTLGEARCGQAGGGASAESSAESSGVQHGDDVHKQYPGVAPGFVPAWQAESFDDLDKRRHALNCFVQAVRIVIVRCAVPSMRDLFANRLGTA